MRDILSKANRRESKLLLNAESLSREIRDFSLEKGIIIHNLKSTDLGDDRRWQLGSRRVGSRRRRLITRICRRHIRWWFLITRREVRWRIVVIMRWRWRHVVLGTTTIGRTTARVRRRIVLRRWAPWLLTWHLLLSLYVLLLLHLQGKSTNLYISWIVIFELFIFYRLAKASSFH